MWLQTRVSFAHWNTFYMLRDYLPFDGFENNFDDVFFCFVQLLASIWGMGKIECVTIGYNEHKADFKIEMVEQTKSSNVKTPSNNEFWNKKK